MYITGAGALLTSPLRNFYVNGASSSNVDMTVTSSATVTAGTYNWYFDAPLVGTSNEISISSQSFVRAQTSNFVMASTGSLWLTVTGSSILTAISNNNLEVDGDCGMLRVAFTSSTITAAVNNIFVGGSILSDLTPNYVYMTTAT
ncbi:transmembrane protein, putative, partial [Bodo saltans]